ncbi:TonB family protein [Mucilaginibacter sp. KACC 22063]|uniref:TonB family protein n=1 Tax=Mucilaginibacter sp. KACC 22063 TaxID=3025666 RepID=UPI0023660EF6|nr:TonB family protein [Mucilaginibacter sp. KACC 22063]WDF55055.1 TonB family protein [Mucilaginibacter sp. KACC 22063]
MSKQRHDISQIKKYLNGELDARAMHKLEREALDDPFLMDALQGYEQLNSDPENDLANLHQRLSNRVQQQQRKIVRLWPLISVAASVLVFVMVGAWWLLRNQKKGQLPVPVNQVVVNPSIIEPPVEKKPSPIPIVKQPVIAQAKPRYNKPAIVAEVAPAIQSSATDSSALDFRTNLVAAAKAPNRVALRGGNRINIRGISSIDTSKHPLYIVDGIPANNIDKINPNEIASINILKKDSASTALYGYRAANGVVLITTKHGQQAYARIGTKADSSKMLNEVVVTGYLPQKKQEVSMAAATVIGQSSNYALQGKLAGVEVNSKRLTKKDSLITVTGRVIDSDDKQPLPGVSISVAGKDKHAVTDAQGRFTLQVNKKDVLNTGYVGYETQQVKVRGDSLNIVLNHQSMALNEVVVGYGEQKQQIITAHPVNGWKAFKNYLKANAAAQTKGGVVKVKFTVNIDGSLSDFIIVKSLNEVADITAIALIKNGPKWQPNANNKAESIKVKIRFPQKD